MGRYLDIAMSVMASLPAKPELDRSRQIPDEGERLSELLTRQPVVRVHSRLLGEVVVWAADNAEVPEDTPEVVYRESELRLLVGLAPAEVRAIHAAKRSFDGEVVEGSPELDSEQAIPSHALYTRSAEATRCTEARSNMEIPER
jgi:hypothetical protein